jgi:hypothetical protein
MDFLYTSQPVTSLQSSAHRLSLLLEHSGTAICNTLCFHPYCTPTLSSLCKAQSGCLMPCPPCLLHMTSPSERLSDVFVYKLQTPEGSNAYLFINNLPVPRTVPQTGPTQWTFAEWINQWINKHGNNGILLIPEPLKNSESLHSQPFSKPSLVCLRAIWTGEGQNLCVAGGHWGSLQDSSTFWDRGMTCF